MAARKSTAGSCSGLHWIRYACPHRRGECPGNVLSLLDEVRPFTIQTITVRPNEPTTPASIFVLALVTLVAVGATLWLQRRKADQQLKETAAEAMRRTQASLESALRETVAELREGLVTQQHVAIAALTDTLERRQTSSAATAQAAAAQQSHHELELIRSELAPLQQGLSRLTQHLTEVRANSSGDLAAIGTLLQRVTEEQRHHREDTRQLYRALRTSHVRGQYGELTLQRTLEHAGLQEHVHYLLQPTERDEGGSLRPDVLIRLPGRRCLVVDSKTPLDALTGVMGAKDRGEQEQHAQAHARLLRGHIDALSRRDYAARLRAANSLVEGETVIEASLLFLPSQPALDVALRTDESILAYAFDRRVFLVTPSTLLLALSTVSQLWQHDSLTQHAHEVLRLGAQLHGRIGTLAEHMSKMGRAMGSAVDAYNAAVRSLDSRVLNTARRFAQLGAASRDATPVVKPLEHAVQPVSAQLLSSSCSDEGRAADSAPPVDAVSRHAA
jgi:DNA recombination protein RmuC